MDSSNYKIVLPLHPRVSKILKYEDQDFGGISGITLSENGENFVLLSDKSFFFKGKIPLTFKN